jgi:hypothetical protein
MPAACTNKHTRLRQGLDVDRDQTSEPTPSLGFVGHSPSGRAAARAGQVPEGRSRCAALPSPPALRRIPVTCLLGSATLRWAGGCGLRYLPTLSPRRVEKLLRMSSGMWRVGRPAPRIFLRSLRLLRRKCAVGPAGRLMSSRPLGRLLFSLTTRRDVKPRAAAYCTI